MLVSIKWLEEILGTHLALETLKVVALNLGLEIESAESLAPAGIVLGQIQGIVPHPKQKNLKVLTIKTNKKVQIVTAAQNVKQGDFVLVVPAGTTFKGEEIKERDFEGVSSQGMLVSEQELGLAEKSVGVIVLEQGKPGVLFKEFFDDVVVDMKTTPNRPDWLSVMGIAQDLAIGLGISMKKLAGHEPIKQINRMAGFKIRIQDLEGCPRYTARIFEDVSVGESPFATKWRLYCMGMNAINNVVDITNIVMLLTGQPLHPFDLDLLKGSILIRKAHEQEGFVTLEGTLLKLDKHDLVIADADGSVALAGVVGSKRAQISSATKRVLLESAYFNPKRVAHTSRRLGLKTEASMRFERGGDIWAADQASEQCRDLFKTHVKAQEVEFIGVGKKGKPTYVRFSRERLNAILSLRLTGSRIKALLAKAGVLVTGRNLLRARIPSYRRDLNIAEDIYEEVGRIYGYAKIPERAPQKWAAQALINKNLNYEEAMRSYLVGQGFSETYNLSLVASERLKEFGFSNFVKIRNPLSERFDALRPNLFVPLLDCLNYNLAKGNRSLKIFEIGNILLANAPYQEKRLGLLMGGERYPGYWAQDNELINYYDTKGVVETIFSFLHLKENSFKPANKSGLENALEVFYSGRVCGYLGQIQESLCKGQYFYAELALDSIWSYIVEPFYIPTPKFPANTRDLSFLVDEKVEVPLVIDLIVRVSGPVLEKVNLFDYYKGDNLPPGKKNLGFRLDFRAPDRTLTDQEVDGFVNKIAGDVMDTFGAALRTKERNWTN